MAFQPDISAFKPTGVSWLASEVTMPNELRPTATAQGNPTEKLTKVFDTKEESEAMVVYGLLESSGINGVLTSQEASEEVLPGVGHMEIVVPDELAEEARQVIAAYREAPETLETAEPDELIVERPEGGGEPAA